jgi:hypothetical protein
MESRSARGRRTRPTARFKSTFLRVLVVTLLFAALSFTPIFAARHGDSGAARLRRRDVSLSPAEVGTLTLKLEILVQWMSLVLVYITTAFF